MTGPGTGVEATAVDPMMEEVAVAVNATTKLVTALVGLSSPQPHAKPVVGAGKWTTKPVAVQARCQIWMPKSLSLVKTDVKTAGFHTQTRCPAAVMAPC